MRIPPRPNCQIEILRECRTKSLRKLRRLDHPSKDYIKSVTKLAEHVPGCGNIASIFFEAAHFKFADALGLRSYPHITIFS